ncbi:disks large-associated protein 5 [Sphaeramia orbicularis]|uniref:Discs, large (Drosophila) homolog-associated protein 5 n=1 Tax=Sphaeramia orbicularis TaxID=375764 RepID=A0A673AJM9_9TELE|nr:disks large-associated protein 5 [Sphaeramia orbicularis]
MESRFSHLRQRDNSVSMLRVKMSRRRSQSQKENRERAVNTRRQLDKLAELEMSSLDASIAMGNMSVIQEKTVNTAKTTKNAAVEERMKQLERWKERKTLEKEKQKREKERKGVFKTGLYHPKDVLTIAPLPMVPVASTRAKETKVNTVSSQSSRVTRSMRQQQVQKPLKMHDSSIVPKKVQPAVERSARSRGAPPKAASVIALPKNKVFAVEPVVRALSTRSANRPPVTAVPAVKDNPKDKCADVRTTRSRAFVNPVAPSSDRERNCKGKIRNTAKPADRQSIPKPVLESEMHELEQKPYPAGPTSCSEEENVAVDQAVADSGLDKDPVEVSSSLSSFAPEGFVFHAPTGLSSFKFDPLTPRSADAFLTPSPSFNLPPAPVFNDEPQDEPSKPSPPKSPCRSPQHTSPTMGAPPPDSPLESKHDVPYFRSQITNETDRLTSLCMQWESKVEDESIPEEMRDRMRTAVGQARLLMKERFNQFSGLVDDCEFSRGEKVTTCTDLQGFWDMVYFQVEDVNKKFGALKEAEAQGWVEEQKPPPRQKKVVKKPSAAPVKPTGNKAAARSRLAAVKAAMKAKQQAAESEKAAKADGTTEEPSLSSQEPQPEAQSLDTVVFSEGFFQVKSPAKTPGSVRRSSRLSAAVLPQPSPSNHITPRRVTRRSLALAQTPVLQTNASPAQPTLTPAHLCRTLNKTPAQATPSQPGAPHLPGSRSDTGNVSLHFSPVKEDNTETISTQDTSVHEMSLPALEQSLPSAAVAEDTNKPAEDNNAVLPLSPCKSPPPAPSAAMSFTLSPCGTPHQSQLSSPAVQGLMTVPDSTGNTPDCSVNEGMPALDFERYFQPSQRCSLSPREMVAIESPSPMEVDVEMENPAGQCEGLHTQQEPAPPTVPALFTPQSPQVQTAESALLLFTPDVKDRIRQSVCPSDLMVFTPPKL